MSWFRFCSLIFLFWAVVFTLFPRFTNDFAAIGYTRSQHAEDWTQLVGLLSLGFAVVLNGAHRTVNVEARSLIARGVLTCTLLCAILMTFWQIIPERRWTRLDILNISVLYVMSYGMFLKSRLPNSKN